MKKFLKFLGVMATVFTAVLGALAVFDRINNKNRIEGDYLECEVKESVEE